MPRVKDIRPHLSAIASSFKGMTGVRGIYVWGSFSANIDRPNFRVRDIDLLARTQFHSGDLVSVGEDIIKRAMTQEGLENMGYDPRCVAFSRDFTKPSKYDMDFWAISSDRKLLHWGPIMINAEESQSVHKEAAEYAKKETGVDRLKMGHAEEETRENWYKSFCRYLDNYFQGMPSGWYKTEDMKIKDILSKAIRL